MRNVRVVSGRRGARTGRRGAAGWGLVVVTVAVAAGACAAAGCGRGEDVRADAWDDGGAPEPEAELRVLAPSGRLAPSAWGIEARADGQTLTGASTRETFVVAVPAGARRIVVAAPGCVPVETPPADDGRTIVRLRPGPRVTLKVLDVPTFSDPLARLCVVLSARGPTTAGSRVLVLRSMEAAALVEERGFASAGARVPADGVVALHVPVAGDYAVHWVVERAGRRTGVPDATAVVTVPAGGRTDPVEVRFRPAGGELK